MTVAITVEHNEARLAGSLAHLDSGTGHARICIYDGARPALGAQPTGHLLVELVLPKPCGVIADNKLTLTPGDDGLVLLSGAATWARVLCGNGDVAFDCDVSDMQGSAAIKLPSTTLYAGGVTRLVSGLLR